MQEGIEDESILHEVVVEWWWRTRITRIQGLWGLDGRRRWWWETDQEEGERPVEVSLRSQGGRPQAGAALEEEEGREEEES